MHAWSSLATKKQKFRIGVQSCVAEAFRILVDACRVMDERAFQDLGAGPRSSTCPFSSPAFAIFGGVEVSTTACAACGHYIVNHARFNVLTLTLPAPTLVDNAGVMVAPVYFATAAPHLHEE